MAKKEEEKLYGLTGVNPNYDGGEKPKEEPAPVAYDKDADYMALMNDAAKRGDFAAAAQYETLRNGKIAGEGLDVPQTHTYEKYDPEKRYSFDPTKDATYQRYSAEMDAIYDKIMNRGEFSYDAENDPVYQAYRRQYTDLGRTAMRDTIGQASALTGGYGSTYAEQAGQQAFNAYLKRLNDVMPELYGAAYDRYTKEGSDLMARYQMAASGADKAYERGYNAWSTRLGLERADEQSAYERRTNEENTAYARAESELQNYRSFLVALIGNGYMPTADDLTRAGMTQAQADALHQKYLMSFNSGTGGGRSGSGGSSRRSSGSGNGSSSTASQPAATSNGVADFTKTVKTIDDAIASGMSDYRVEHMIQTALDGGLISNTLALMLRAKLKKRGG